MKRAISREVGTGLVRGRLLLVALGQYNVSERGLARRDLLLNAMTNSML